MAKKKVVCPPCPEVPKGKRAVYVSQAEHRKLRMKAAEEDRDITDVVSDLLGLSEEDEEETKEED